MIHFFIVRALSTDIHDLDARPYFLWDESTTNGAFRDALARANDEEKARLLGKLLREARDEDVWEFTNVGEVRALFPKIERYLGRRRDFWRYLLDAWKRHGIA